jgi:ribosomal protein S2
MSVSLISLLTQSRLHLGHSPKLLHPLMRSKVIGERAGVAIIDLQQTEQAIERAKQVCKATAQNGGIILLIGGKVRDEKKKDAKNTKERGNGRIILHERSKLGRDIERIARQSWAYAITRSR